MTFFTKENTLQFVHAECYENRLADAKATSTLSFFSLSIFFRGLFLLLGSALLRIP